MSEANQIEYDVIVVGAGLSGLASAHSLIKSNPNLKILILEANDRVGGRLYTTSFDFEGTEYNVDLGGMWLGLKML